MAIIALGAELKGNVTAPSSNLIYFCVIKTKMHLIFLLLSQYKLVSMFGSSFNEQWCLNKFKAGSFGYDEVLNIFVSPIHSYEVEWRRRESCEMKCERKDEIYPDFMKKMYLYLLKIRMFSSNNMYSIYSRTSINRTHRAFDFFFLWIHPAGVKIPLNFREATIVSVCLVRSYIQSFFVKYL